jgi:hypothetical protein
MRMVPSICSPRSGVLTPPGCSDTFDVSHSDRARGRLLGERHMASDISIVVRAAHAEPGGRNRTVPGQLSGGSAAGDEGKKARGENRAHGETRQRNSGSFKLARVTMSKVCRDEKTAAAGAGRFEVVLP